ncbi:flagellar basal body-associated protein FliL [Thalassovita gelatinovora]|uniref:Flagellar protein FliL n=1 Tax=Thalassovita gelatinovora TaxID=53501 RepID=A0A0P1FKD2_THAGE|nr:flagellar basal body-associated FliL family protein [Thalassovita gelatinovora]QIZ82404.1 flagellar basal body-associated FliL family protein [Thalassovita gelatinovora]CUH68485.1 flagellar basal body-associated protein FliL [Thalassovita gelatinovora]SEQ53303.1 flagellar FliL protein [Thalassovita gelatinovora]
MANVTIDGSQKKKGGILKTLFQLIVACGLASGGFVAGQFFAQSTMSPADEVLRLIEETGSDNVHDSAGNTPQKVPRDLPDAPVFETQYYEFPEPLTTNLKGSARFLQLGIGLSTQYDEAVLRNVQTHRMALRSDMLAVISSFTEEDVEGTAGRDALSVALRDAINNRLERLEGFGGIEGVFFPVFVMQ